MSGDRRKYDLCGERFKADPFPTFAAMRERDPVLHQLGLDGSGQGWFLSRYEDVELRGRHIRRGDPVILILSSANRGPEAFASPDALDIARHPNHHLGFGKEPITAWARRWRGSRPRWR